MSFAPSADYSAALVDGPWDHEFVSANGARFHVALAGAQDPSAPLVILLHDFGQCWWAWRHQIPALAEAGYRVAAMDLRGVAASDKPPAGYDTPTRTRDVAGVIRSLGFTRAAVVGHGTGGTVAWAMAALQPAVTAGVAAFAAAHPARVHAPFATQYTRAAWKLVSLVQIPVLPERRLRNGSLLERLFALGGGKPLPSEAVDFYHTAMLIPFAAHTSAEALRWTVRATTPRPDGMRYTAAVRREITQPTMQVHGALDGILRRDRVDADGAAFSRDFRFEVFDDVGHYQPETAPERTTDLLLDWLPHTRA